ncbi:MAG: hypothetical protein R2911_05140 [Caldilineaceae bacterium]
MVGEQGAVQVDAFEQHVALSSEKTGKTQWVNWGSNMDLGLVRDFVDAIRTCRLPSINGEDGQGAGGGAGGLSLGGNGAAGAFAFMMRLKYDWAGITMIAVR